MGNEFTFYDYFDADGTGANIINNWLNDEGKPAKAHFDRMVEYLSASSPPGFQDTFWCSPYTWPLHGKWEGFVEIRKKVNGVQFRLICKLESRDVFLITWGFHKGNWEAAILPRTAKTRITQMKQDPAKYRREHDNS